MDKVIFKSAELNCKQEKAFKMFTVNRNLEKWLAVKADVEPMVGGKYELFWNPDTPEDDSTIGCKVLAVDKPFFINFEWKGTKRHKEFMNTVLPLTNVSVCFVPVSGSRTKVFLIHTGWRHNDEWEQARKWFETAWQDALNQLDKILNE